MTGFEQDPVVHEPEPIDDLPPVETENRSFRPDGRQHRKNIIREVVGLYPDEMLIDDIPGESSGT